MNIKANNKEGDRSNIDKEFFPFLLARMKTSIEWKLV